MPNTAWREGCGESRRTEAAGRHQVSACRREIWDFLHRRVMQAGAVGDASGMLLVCCPPGYPPPALQMPVTGCALHELEFLASITRSLELEMLCMGVFFARALFEGGFPD